MTPMGAGFARDLTLVVHDRGDAGAEAIVAAVGGSVVDGLARPFLRVVVGADDHDPDPVRWSGSAMGPDGAASVDRVFDRIARARGAINIQLVGLLTVPRDERVAARLDDAIQRMHQALERMLGRGMAVVEARLAVLGYSEPMVHERFFSSAFARNIAVLPLDRSDDKSAARPIERSDVEAFRDHGAIETMTVCGLWSSVASGPLPDMDITHAMGGEPQVRLVQSSVRFLRTPPIPARDLVDVARELPIPELFMPANDPLRRLPDLFARVRSIALDYESVDPPRLGRLELGLGSLLARIATDVLSILRELPRIIVTTARGEVAVLSQRAAQRAVGEDSRIRVQLDRAVERAADSGTPFDPEAFADEVDVLLRRSDMQFVDPVPGDIWTSLSQSILGVLDGDPDSSGDRQAALGDASLVVTDRSVVTGGVPWDRAWVTGERVGADARGPELVFNPPEELLVPQVRQDTDWVMDLMGLDDLDLAAEDIDDEGAVESADGATEEDEDEAREEPLDRALLHLRDHALPEVIDAPHHGLLLRVLTDLRRQRRNATLDVRRLVELALRTGTERPLLVRPWVSVLAVSGFALVVFVLGTSDTAERFAMAGGWVLVAREVVFIAATVAIAFFALGVSTLLDRLPEGTKNILLVTGALTSVVGLIIFRERIRTGIPDSLLQGDAVGIAAGLVVVLLVVVAVWQAGRTGDDIRIGAARLLTFAGGIYTFIAVTFVQALDGSTMRSMEGDVGTRIRILMVVAGAILFLTSVTSLVSWRFATNRRLDTLDHERGWAAQRLTTALEARVRLQAAEWQWIGTATVLARLVTYPFGRSDSPITGSVADVADPAVLKGSRATLALTDAGREAIDAKLRSILVTPTWLRQQYELLVRAYREIIARRTGNSVNDLLDRRPEQDSYAPHMDPFDDALLRGDRWEFARRVQAGEFDAVLAESADELDLEEVYGPLLAESGAMVLEETGAGPGTVRDFVELIVPTEPPELPTGITQVLFSGTDDRRSMQTWLWWPKGLLGEARPGERHDAGTRFVRERNGGALVVSAVRLDVSSPFEHGKCFIQASGSTTSDGRTVSERTGA